MSEKNADVERAISAFGGLAITYHSFGPAVMRPRLSADTRSFTYNEFGQAEYATAAPDALPGAALGEGYPVEGVSPGLSTGQSASLAAGLIPGRAVRPQSGSVRTIRAGDPLYDSLPVVEPPLARPLPPAAPPMLRPLQPSAVSVRTVPRPSVQPMPTMQPPLMQAPIPQPSAQTAPPPPPFFPLLAAALPNATEPTYAPTYAPAYQGSPPPGFAAETGRVGLSEPQPSAAPTPTAAAFEPSSDRRSLTEMFRMLQSRGDGLPADQPVQTRGQAAAFGQGGLQPHAAQAPATAASPFAAEGQALFRRI